MACWPFVALLRDYVCICSIYHCLWAWGPDSCPAVCHFGVCVGHVPTLCLRCTRSFVSVVWCSSSVAFLLVPLLPPLSWLRISPTFPVFFFFAVSGVCSRYFHWASGLKVTGDSGGLGIRGVAVAAPWPMGTQSPLATQALNFDLQHQLYRKVKIVNTFCLAAFSPRSWMCSCVLDVFIRRPNIYKEIRKWYNLLQKKRPKRNVST